jgi:hypothetical protein
MSRLIHCAVAAVAFLMVFVGCGRREGPWSELPSSAGLPYTVSIRTHRDGQYADQPFELRIVSKLLPGRVSQVIFAEQCKSVSVAQTSGNLYIFYDEIALRGFSSFQYADSLPRPFLCDMHQEFCRDTLQLITESKGLVSQACSYQ